MTQSRIPFNKPCFEGKELVYIAEAINNGHISGDGAFTKRCHTFLEEELSVKKAFLTTSCTHALETAAILLNMEAGDEVIVPSFTFVSTANAFALHKARTVFADIRPDTLNLDEGQLEQLITPRTKAIVPVHYAGVGCEMDAILDIARRHDIPLVEDNAHGLFGKYKDRFLGTFGSMATLSFHETKNFTCGEGGALLINDSRYIERAEIVREKGTNRSRLFRGEIDKYTWLDVGSSYLPSDILAGFLYAQLEAKDHIQEHRRRIVLRLPFERLGKTARRRTSQNPAPLRTPVPHVLHGNALLRRPPANDCSSQVTPHPRRLPLFAPSSFADGSSNGRKRGRLPRNRRYQQPTDSTAVLQ
jgi:dTDP-4-amino-4,6-dideoxygalactose transaminase